MALVWYRFHCGFGRRWRAYVSAALVLGLIGGVALAAISGARRTASAHTRFLRGAKSSTMALNAGSYDQRLDDAVRALPQVQTATTYVAFDGLFYGTGGRGPDVAANAQSPEIVGSLDGRYFTQDRFFVLHGRMANPSRADEVMVDEPSAALGGLHVGERRDFGTWDDKDVQNPTFFQHPTVPKDKLTVTIVGIGVFTDEIIQDDQDRQPRILMTPAFTQRNFQWKTYGWQGLTLKRGDADVAAVTRAFVSLLRPGYPQFSRITSVDAAHAQRAIRPHALALGIFGGIAFLATVVLAGQALVRLVNFDRDALVVLRAMGASPGSTSAAALPGAATSALVGTVLALLVAIALSPLSPIGPVRRVDHRGVNLDWTVLGAGGLGLVVMLTLVAAAAGRRQAPHRVQARTGRLRPRASVAAARAGAAGLPASAVSGIQMAFRAEAGSTSAPVRMTIVGPVVAVVALVAALCFGQSIRDLVHHPRLYGWNWDAALADQAGYGNINVDKAHAVLDHDGAVADWSSVYFGSGTVGNLTVPMLGMDPKASVTPPILSGRWIAAATEIVLGPVTLTSLHRHVGDNVTVGEGDTARSVRIVGTATFPAMGVAHGLHASLGTGAVVDPALIPGAKISITGAGRAGPSTVFVRFRSGSNAAAERAQLQDSAQAMADQPGAIQVNEVQRPAEIVDYAAQGTAPAALAGGLCLAALISLTLSLGSSVRRRRRDLALLKALGFTRAQLAATVAWQATATIAVGLVLGIPLGIAFGRWLWILFARQLAVVPAPVVPLVPVLVAGLGIVLLANAAAAWPALVAARTPTAPLLREGG